MAKKYISEKIRMKSESRLAAVQATYMIAAAENPVEEVIRDFVDGKVGRYVIACQLFCSPHGGTYSRIYPFGNSFVAWTFYIICTMMVTGEHFYIIVRA